MVSTTHITPLEGNLVYAYEKVWAENLSLGLRRCDFVWYLRDMKRFPVQLYDMKSIEKWSIISDAILFGMLNKWLLLKQDFW